MRRSVILLALSLNACSKPNYATACDIAIDPDRYVGRDITIEDVIVPGVSPDGPDFVTSVEACPRRESVIVHVPSFSDDRNIESLRSDIGRAESESRPDRQLGVLARISGPLQRDRDGVLKITIERVHHHQLANADKQHDSILNEMRAAEETDLRSR